jgi:hypothetical protein
MTSDADTASGDARPPAARARAVVITVAGEIDDRLRDEFEDVDVGVDVDHGVTRIRVGSPDSSVVHGVLHRVEVLGLELLDVHPTGVDRA